MKKQPEVTAQTRRKLMDSFWQLYCDKGMSNVTVGSLTRMAGFNRSTFYEYFTDIYDLLETLEDELLADLEMRMESRFKEGFPDNFTEFSRSCAQIFSAYDDKIYILLSNRGDPGFHAKLKQKVEPVLLKNFGFSITEPYLEYMITFAFSAMIGMLNLWYENGKEMSIETLFQIMQSLVANGVLGVTKKTPFEHGTE